MVAMPRPRPLHVHRETSRHGRTVWYVRIGKGPRIRLRAEFGSPEFEAEYHSAIGGNTPPAKAEPSAGTLGWLIARYRETSAWLKPAAATRRQREPAPTQVEPDRFAQDKPRPGQARGVRGGGSRPPLPLALAPFQRYPLVSLDHPYRK
jgi:hypothetical protein